MFSSLLCGSTGKDTSLVVSDNLMDMSVALFLARIVPLAILRCLGTLDRTFGAINNQIQQVLLFLFA